MADTGTQDAAVIAGRHLSPLERAKAAYRPMVSVDALVGITKREPAHLQAMKGK